MIYENEIYYQVQNRDYLFPDNRGFEHRTVGRWVVKRVGSSYKHQRNAAKKRAILAAIGMILCLFLQWKLNAQMTRYTIRPGQKDSFSFSIHTPSILPRHDPVAPKKNLTDYEVQLVLDDLYNWPVKPEPLKPILTDSTIRSDIMAYYLVSAFGPGSGFESTNNNYYNIQIEGFKQDSSAYYGLAAMKRARFLYDSAYKVCPSCNWCLTGFSFSGKGVWKSADIRIIKCKE